MAALAVIIPPKDLIPVAFVLEGAASLAMLRGGIKEADMRIVLGLAIFSAIGVPIGMYATLAMPVATSKTIALTLILLLTGLQLFRAAPAFLGTRTGLYATGLIAGITTGLAGVGGMVVALYVLASNKAPRQMRGSMVMFLFMGMFTSGITYTTYGLFTPDALARAAVFLPIIILGVWLGTRLFRPGLEPFYRLFCLLLLMGLAAIGLTRMLG